MARTGFGGRPDEIQAASAAGDLRALVSQLLTAPAQDPGATATPPPAFTEPAPPDRKDPQSIKAYQKALQAQSQQLILWWLDRMVAVTHPWPEKRTLLWHGHWATSIQKVRSAALMLGQNQTMRTQGGGDFLTFARTMIRDPALMVWLDAGGNSAKAPNENLAREFMELFTLGVGHYGEQDVRQAALALTGWVVNRASEAPRFVPQRHAPGTQTILGRTESFTDQSFADLVVAQPACPVRLISRFWSWLVSPTPPATDAVARMTQAYGQKRDLTALFTAMLSEPAIAAPDSVLVKQPVEWLVGAMRALDVRPAKLPEPDQRQLLAGLQLLGQVPFTPPNVGGWPLGEAWLTTAAAEGRLRLATLLVKHADLAASPVAKAPPAQRPAALATELGLTQWTPRTTSALTPLASTPERLIALGLCAPEYVVSA